MNTDDVQKIIPKTEPCGSFLCPSDGICKNVDISTTVLNSCHYYDLAMSASNVLLSIGNNIDFVDILLAPVTKQEYWSKCFERRHVWNQIRPSWYEAILNLISPLLPTISYIVINAVKTGASMYQAMSIILASFSQFLECTNPALTKIAF
ncbi:unnamed protein product [Brassicogethes aeneus]|uniref:Uncharacterized protein n=1 Tax=Brassicogethes aeneus TaxID=1431903 RepID=A0A9P0BBB4_BRAAE|nr:unnamed protein product [Brassicogethes aeneus]